MQLPHGQVFQLSRRVAAKRDGQAAADRAIDGTLMAFVLGSMLPIMQPLPSIPIPSALMFPYLFLSEIQHGRVIGPRENLDNNLLS
jgi:hypothetical protein